MLESIRSFFDRRMQAAAETNGGGTPDKEDTYKLHVAACALMLELAYADDVFTEDERTHIEAVLMRHFDLDAETAASLIELADAERKASTDLYQFTSLIRTNYDLGQKTLLAEIMWGLILTDGEIARHEGYLLRKIGNLLDLKPGYLAEAKNAAAAKIK